MFFVSVLISTLKQVFVQIHFHEIYSKTQNILGLYSCQLTPLPLINKELSLFQAKIVIQVSAGNIFTEHRDISFLPSVFINKKELFFGQFSGKDNLIIVGLPQVLSQIEVSFF